ncbi:hypothetical protein, partial [Acinetobacter baylyi]
DFGDRPARREGGFGDRPQRSFGDDRPKRSFGGEDRPRRATQEEFFNRESGDRRRKNDR